MSVNPCSDSSEVCQSHNAVPIVPSDLGARTATAADADLCPDSVEGLPASWAKRPDIGLARTAKHLGYRAARRLFKLEIADILALDLGPMRQMPPEKSRFEFRFLSAEEIRAAASDPANNLKAEMAGRLEFGRSFCFAAVDRGRLANYSWYALRHVEPEHSFNLGLTLPDDTVYMYKAFTLPAYRGQRLHQATIHRAVQAFAATGIRRLVAIVEYGHWASLRSHLRMGCRRAGRFCLIRRRPILWQCDANHAGNLKPGCPPGPPRSRAPG